MRDARSLDAHSRRNVVLRETTFSSERSPQTQRGKTATLDEDAEGVSVQLALCQVFRLHARDGTPTIHLGEFVWWIDFSTSDRSVDVPVRLRYGPSVGIRITGRLGGGFVPFGDPEGHLFLPCRYTLEDDEAAAGNLEVDVVVEDGRPIAERVIVQRRPGGPSVTAESLRTIPLGRYLRASAVIAAMKGEQKDDGSITLEPVEATSDADTLVDADRRAAGRGRRRTVTADHLAEVARVYEAELGRAREGGQAGPTAAVARHWTVARPTASRWVRLARERGFLAPYGKDER